MNREIVASLVLRLRDQLSGNLGKTNAALSKHVAELKKLDRASKAIGSYDKASAGLQKIRTELERTRQKIGHIRTAMQTADKSDLPNLRAMLTRTEQHADRTATKMVQDVNRVKQAITALNNQGIRVKDLDNARARIQQQKDDEKRRFEDGKNRERRDALVRKGGERVRDFGRNSTAMTAVGGYTVLRLIENERQFQDRSNAAQAKFDVSQKEYKPLRDDIIELQKKLPLSSTEVTDGAVQLAATGLDVEQARGILPSVAGLKVAAGDEMSMEELTDIATNIATAMQLNLKGLEQSKATMNEVSDEYAYTVQKSAMNWRDLGQAMKYSGTLAAQLGVPMEHLFAIFHSQAGKGIRNSEAGTSMRALFVRMLAPTKPQLAEMERIGLNNDDYVKRTKPLTGADVEASLRGQGLSVDGIAPAIDEMIRNTDLDGDGLLNGIIDLIAEQMGGADGAARDSLADAVIGALSAGASEVDLLGLLADMERVTGGNTAASLARIAGAKQGGRIAGIDMAEVRAFLEKLESDAPGYLERVIAVRMQGMVGDLARMQSAFDSLVRTFFESGASDLVGEVARALESIMLSLQKVDPEIQKLIAQFIALSLVVGPLAIMLGSMILIGSKVTKLVGLFAGAVTGMTAISKKLGVLGGAAGVAGAVEGKKKPGGAIGAGRMVTGAIGLWGVIDGFLDFEKRKQAYEEQGLSASEALTKAMQDNQAATERLNSWLEQTIGTPRSWFGLDDEEGSPAGPRGASGPSHRAAERASMDELHRDPHGVQDAIDDAAADKTARDARTEAQVQEILVRALAGAVAGVETAGKSGRLGSIPVPSPNPRSDAANARVANAFDTAAQPIPNGYNEALDGMIAAIERQTGSTQSVQVTSPVTTQPSGVQQVFVQNPSPIMAPISIVQHITSNASPAAIGAAAGNAVAGAVKGAQTNSYADD